MAEPSSSRSPGGCLLALAILVGAGIGLAVGQQTVGLLGGLGVGVVIATLLWWRDRR